MESREWKDPSGSASPLDPDRELSEVVDRHELGITVHNLELTLVPQEYVPDYKYRFLFVIMLLMVL